jgi:hypothetical protein
MIADSQPGQLAGAGKGNAQLLSVVIAGLRNYRASGGTGFDPAHLWFLYVLLMFSVVLLPLFGYLQRPRGARLADRAIMPPGRIREQRPG